MLSKVLDRVGRMHPMTLWGSAVGFSLLVWASVALIGVGIAGVL